MTKRNEHPIAHRNPALVVDLCYAATDPIGLGDLKAAAKTAGHAQADATIVKTIEDLVDLGALRKVRHFNRRNSTVTYSLKLTDLGRRWLTPDAVILPSLELKDEGGYRWHHPTPDDDPPPP